MSKLPLGSNSGSICLDSELKIGEPSGRGNKTNGNSHLATPNFGTQGCYN